MERLRNIETQSYLLSENYGDEFLENKKNKCFTETIFIQFPELEDTCLKENLILKI